MGRNPDSYHILRRLQLLSAAGCFLIFLYGLRVPPTWDSLRIFGLGILVAAASLTAGFLLGVVFAIPRDGNEGATAKPAAASSNSLPPDDPKADKAPASPDNSQKGSGGNDARVRPNSNLVEISDWLTKIIVGVGLVELKTIPAKLGKLSLYLGHGLEGDDASKLLISGQSAGLAIMVFYSTVGFLMGYVWTRLYFSRDLEDQIYRLEEDKANLEDEKDALQQDKSSLEQEKSALQRDKTSLENEKDSLEQEKENLKQEGDDLARDKLILAVEQMIREGQLDAAMQNIDSWLAHYPQDGRLILTKARILKRQAIPAPPTPAPPEAERQRLLNLAVDLASRAFAQLPPDKQAEPLYNKACYQALLDTAANKSEILANLQSAFAINPSLRQTARNDNDLAGLRQDPDFMRLVGDAGGKND
jgi:hypothetical protein